MDESQRELDKKLGATRDPNPSDNNATGRLDKDIFDMESCKYRGHALVINNHQFKTDALKNREGWKADSENLQKLFNFLRFEQLELCNLNAKEVNEAIANFARDEKSLNASSLAVVIMTHGDENSFFGVDGRKIHPYDDVLLNFHRDKAPDLIEKPKLFIFQACRGNRKDWVQQVFVPQYESEAMVAGATGGQPVQRKNVPLPNMLIVNATLPGYLAYRHTTEGSWLISDFCRIVRSKAREDHVADIITEVSRVLNDREVEAIQQIHPENLLSRKWFLFPRERSPHELRTPSEDSVEFKMEDRHKECLVKNRNFLLSEISLSAVLLANLTESDVITDEHLQKLQNIKRNDTTKVAVFEFLSEVLPKRGPEAFDLFLKALCESEQRHVAERLKQWLSDDCSEEAGTFERLQDELRTHYNDKLKFVYTMPWLPTEGFSLKETFVQRRLRLTSGDRKGTEVKMDEILASVGEGRNKRILVEGDPAQGKSTLCQALAFAWSQPDEASENIKSFDLVILLHAGDLRGQDSVGGAIKEHLLPIDWDIPSRQLEKLLQEKNVLLIIDAFDEASKKNEIIHQLIEGKRLKHKPLLITSRPNFLENKQRHFESTFTVEGYDEEEQLKHVERYAKHQNIASAPFESMLEEESIIDLCSNPLNLTLLCLLREEDTQLRITRTALYTEIHRIIRRKAGERMDLTEAEVEESLLRPLYQFAFEAYQRNETVVREKDSKKVENFQRICQVGYLTNEVIISRLQKEVRFQFTHKTFVEFLTAKHIAEMDQEERLNWMQHLRYADYHIRIHGLAIDDDFNVEQNEAILGFIFGLLEEESAELTQMASLVIKETRFSSEPHHPLSLFVSPCDASHHQLLRLLAELNVVPQELADVICKRRPPLINIHDDCSVSCRRGMLKLCNLRFQPPIPMNVNLSYSLDEEEKMSFVQKLIKSESIDCSKIWIKPRDHTELWNDVRGWRIGQADSIQQVSIHCYRIEGNPCEKFSFGNHLSELELIHYEPSHSFLLEAALHKPLTSLQLICCHELDDRCISLIRQLLRNQRNLQRVQLTSFPWQQRFGFFLADFAQMENLQSLEIELIDSTDEEMRSLEAILKRNKLSELTIDSYYSGSLESVLNEGFHSMSSLRELHLRRVNIIHLPNLRHLDLINFSLLPPFIFSLRHSTLNDDGIAVLSDALRSWRNLQQLRIHFDEDEDVSVAECSLRKLFEAIAGCHRLQILYFDRLEMADSVVPSVCKMIESLKQLREFTSKDQRDESLTEEGFKQLEPIIKRNGLNTEVRSALIL